MKSHTINGNGSRRASAFLSGYRRLANEVCSEACAEMSGLLEAPLDEAEAERGGAWGCLSA